MNPVTNTVGTTPTKVLNNNPDRILALLVNLTANDGYVGFDNEVSATRGIPVPSNGGSLTLLIDEDGELVIQETYAVCPGGAGTWYIVEIERL